MFCIDSALVQTLLTPLERSLTCLQPSKSLIVTGFLLYFQGCVKCISCDCSIEPLCHKKNVSVHSQKMFSMRGRHSSFFGQDRNFFSHRCFSKILSSPVFNLTLLVQPRTVFIKDKVNTRMSLELVVSICAKVELMHEKLRYD